MISVHTLTAFVVLSTISSVLGAQPFVPNVDGTIESTKVLSSGAILIGGSFSNVNSTAVRGIARLTSSGSLDSTFAAGVGVSGASAVVYAIAVQSDDKILIAGDFNNYAGTARNRIARLHANGALDTTFNPGAGPGASIQDIAIQGDGKILVVGVFTSYGGRNYLARLNSDGSLDTTYMATGGPDGPTYSIALQSDGKSIIGGSFWNVSSTWRYGVARMNTDGTLDTTFSVGNGPNNWVLAVAVQPDGKILIAGRFANVDSQPRNGIARLDSTGGVDGSFTASPGVQATSTMQVSTLAIQSDGKIVLGGFFDTIDGMARKNIGRVNSDGSLDTAFSPGSGANNGVATLSLLPDARIIIGGSFSQFNAQVRYRIARLEPTGELEGPRPSIMRGVALNNGGTDVVTGTVGGALTTLVYTLQNLGSLALSVYNTVIQQTVNCTSNVSTFPASAVPAGGSTSFSIQITPTVADFWSCTLTMQTSASPAVFAVFLQGDVQAPNDGFAPAASGGSVDAVTIQPDEKVLIGGSFDYVNYAARSRVARLGVDGRVDSIFAPVSGADATVLAMEVQPDGKVVIGGMFTAFDNVNRGRVARITASGNLDTSFNPGSGANLPVRCIALQPDGKVILGGDFTTFGGTGRNRIVRLNADGSLDNGFDPGTGANSTVSCIVLQPNGQIVVGGSFTTINGASHGYVARLNADGSVDSAFNASTDSSVFSLAVQPNGQILLVGGFSSVNSVTRSSVARINADGTLDSVFNPDANAWVRSIALDATGRIVIGGDFTVVGGVARPRIARLTSVGVVDTSFDPGLGPNNNVWGVRLHGDGKVVISGAFLSVAGVTRAYLARLHADGSLDSQGVRLSRGGAAINSGGSDTLTGTVAGASSALVYSVENLSSVNLKVVGVQLIGTGNCSAAVSANPTALVLPAGMTTFTIQVTPTATGVWSFTLQLVNSGNPGVFTVLVQGNAAAPPSPAIEILQGVAVIANGGGDSLGTTGAVAFDRSYTIRNFGSAVLNLTGTPTVTVQGQSNCTVTLSVAPSAVIGVGASTAFTLNIVPVSAGVYSFAFSIANDDAGDNPYVVNASGITASVGGGGTGGTGGSAGEGGGCTTSEGQAFEWVLLVGMLLAVRFRRSLRQG